ncbi:MAG: DUF4339 domain-containing protein, partial [Planctomycetes bacterium]|nr:DUF4339 domain-containing protein [Planctomycetota bacterium]
MSQARWLVIVRGRQHGPMSARSLVVLVRQGRIGTGDLVSREGSGRWKPVGEVQGLLAAATPGEGATVPIVAATPAVVAATPAVVAATPAVVAATP